ncbi:hypothetical protein ACXDR4_003178 [Klebsiella pneumoniae]
MTDITELAHGLLDFTQPLETESGEPVTYVCHDVIEYKCARVCVDVETGIVYSSPHVGLKIRNVRKYASVRKFTEEAAQAYREHEQGWISDMKCGDRSHEYLSFVRDPKNILALVEALEKAQQRNVELEQGCENDPRIHEIIDLKERIAELEESHAQVIQSRDHYKRISEEGLKQLAESRTVTVKLPSERFRYGDSDYDDGFVNGWNARMAEDTAALDRVGIKWEAE